MKLFVLYLTALDLRWMDGKNTPYLATVLDTCPWARMSNYPGNDLLPTILTGTYPPEHGVWGVRLGNNGRESGTRWTHKLPDILTTTAQCFAHLCTGEFDLAAIPPWRRCRFENTRSKYRRFKRPVEVLYNIAGAPSVLGLIGEDQSRYQFKSPTHPIRRLLPHIGGGNYTLDWLELYSLNQLQQWNMDRPDAIRTYYRKMDLFVERLHAKCQSSGVTLILLNDHGHEAVRESIDLMGPVGKLALRHDEYTFFLEVSTVRFWFHTERARERIQGLLYELEHLNILSPGDREQMHLPFQDNRYGELIAILDPGYIFFPHDFYQPLANLYLGLNDWKQFRRVLDPRQRSNCGYLPQHASEKGFMLLMDASYTAARPQMELIDAAPSLLSLLGREQPDFMKGSPVFKRP